MSIGISTRTEIITPSIATAYLAFNKGNRPISKPRVDNFVKMLLAGRFKLTHQGIAFDTQGNMIDGQHRLHAIVDSGVAVWMQVTRGVEQDSKLAIDSEMRVRSASDVLKIAGCANATKQSVAAIKVWMALLGEKSPALFEQQAFLESHSDSIDYAVRVGCASKKTKHACILAMLAIGHQVGHGDSLEQWCQVVTTGESKAEWHTSALRFRDYWMTSKHSGGTDDRIKYCHRIYASMLAWVEHRGLSKLYAKQSIDWI